MNIVVVNGSPRTSGVTAAILAELEKNLQTKEDVSIEHIDLSTKSILPCKGCSRCFKTGFCYIEDDAESISKSLALADGIIIGTPTYASNVSGLLKTLIDRGHLVMEQLLYGKYSLGVIVGENYGSRTARSILKNLFLYSGASISAMITVKSLFSTAPKLESKHIMLCAKQAELFYQDILRNRRHVLQKITHWFVFNVGIKPFVLKKGTEYQGVIDRWKLTKGSLL